MLSTKDAEIILEKYKDEIADAPCSKGHHLNIVGGLAIHQKNAGHFARELYPMDDNLAALADIHDIGKARTYKINYMDGQDGEYSVEYTKPAVDHLVNTIAMIAEAGFKLEPSELHALQMHHGGWSPFSHSEMTELAVKLHHCDMLAMVKETQGRDNLTHGGKKSSSH